jgi:hypothetical protein
MLIEGINNLVVRQGQTRRKPGTQSHGSTAEATFRYDCQVAENECVVFELSLVDLDVSEYAVAYSSE